MPTRRAIREYMWLIVARADRPLRGFARGDIVDAIPNRGPGWLLPARGIRKEQAGQGRGWLVRVHDIPHEYADTLVEPLRTRERVIARRRWWLDLESLPKKARWLYERKRPWETTYPYVKRILTAKRGPGKSGPPIYLYGLQYEELMEERRKRGFQGYRRRRPMATNTEDVKVRGAGAVIQPEEKQGKTEEEIEALLREKAQLVEAAQEGETR